MKELIVTFAVFRVDNGIRYESGESFIEFIGSTQDGTIDSSQGSLGRYDRDECGDLYVYGEGLSEYVGQTEFHYAMEFLANKRLPL